MYDRGKPEKESNMRLRNIRGAREAMLESPYVIDAPEQWKGRWAELFGNSNQMCIRDRYRAGQGFLQLTEACGPASAG